MTKLMRDYSDMQWEHMERQAAIYRKFYEQLTAEIVEVVSQPGFYGL